MFTPYIGFKLLKPAAAGKHLDEAAVYQTGFYRAFRQIIEFCLMGRYYIIAITAAAFILSLALFRLIPQQFFPASDRPELMVDLWLPQAATFTASDQEVRALEEKLRGDPDVEAVTSYIGGGSPRFYLPLDVQTPNLNLGQLMVMTKGGEARERVLAKLQNIFETDLPTVRGRVNRLENGPPVGYPIQFRIFGPDNHQVLEAAQKVAEILRRNPHTRRVHQDWGEELKRLHLEVDQDKTSALGLSTREIKFALQRAISGTSVTQYRDGDEAMDVVARLVESERTDLNNLKDTKIYLRDGQFVPVSQVAQVQLDSETSIIWRRNRVPTITVRADIEGAEAPDVTAALQPQIDRLAASLPLGYGIEVGGTQESSSRAQAAIKAIIPVAVIVIVFLTMLQLQDMRKTALVLMTAPLGIIGVVLILATFQIPFGFVAMLGMIALAGMIIRNSLILVDQIEQDLIAGASLWDAIVESTVRRFRPIVLTALSAILAMVPLTGSIFWGPMAWTIMGGLLVATLLTLLFLPALYAWVYNAAKPLPTQP